MTGLPPKLGETGALKVWGVKHAVLILAVLAKKPEPVAPPAELAKLAAGYLREAA